MSALIQQVTDVLEDHARRGQVLKLTEEQARAEYPGLTVASLDALKKEKTDCTFTARVLVDGTHGIAVNRRVRIHDQERAPTAADMKRFLREKATMDHQTFALTADIKEDHRQVPIVARDWKFLGCQVVPEWGPWASRRPVTAGRASHRLLGRLTQYVIGARATSWHLLVADDFHLDAGGAGVR